MWVNIYRVRLMHETGTRVVCCCLPKAGRKRNIVAREFEITDRAPLLSFSSAKSLPISTVSLPCDIPCFRLSSPLLDPIPILSSGISVLLREHHVCTLLCTSPSHPSSIPFSLVRSRLTKRVSVELKFRQRALGQPHCRLSESFHT